MQAAIDVTRMIVEEDCGKLAQTDLIADRIASYTETRHCVDLLRLSDEVKYHRELRERQKFEK